MSEQIRITVYTYDELDVEAQERARQWFSEVTTDYDWWDAVYDDFFRICAILGITEVKPGFTGFWSQGDGACFSGRWAYAEGAPEAIREYAPLDTVLHGIADRLDALQQTCETFLAATIRTQGMYCHEGTMYVSDLSVMDGWSEPAGDAEEAVLEAMRDLARRLYDTLECEYEYLHSDEVLAEGIIANEYTFTAAGKRLDQRMLG